MHIIKEYESFNVGVGQKLDICGYACPPDSKMPENPNVDQDIDGFYGNNITMATASNTNANARRQGGQGVPRVSSAGLQYYDIATQLLGKKGSDLEELFIAAARDGVYERIENFLQRNRMEYVVSIDVKDKKTGNTPLIWAAKRGHAKIVQLLLRHGADVTLRNYEGHTAVEVASNAIRSILLDSVERSTEASHQVLLQAAWQGDLKSQKKVLDINCQNAEGYTPVMLATRDMHFFERHAVQMSRPYNPAEALIAHSVVATIISGGPDMEQKDKRCFAPLHCASLTGNADCLSRLLDGGSEHGANVMLTDDRGLNPLDFAKTRKMKKKLKDAWAEASTNKSTTSLGPIRAQSREDLRSSVEDLTKRKKGEVIFEGLPSNPFSDSNKKDTIANSKGLTRHLSLKEKNGQEDDQKQAYTRDSVRKLGQVRSQQKPSPLPRRKSRSTERLPMISPDRLGSDRNLESPIMFNRNARARRSFEDRRGRNRRAPISTREDEEIHEPMTPGAPSPTPSHRRSESDPNRGNPNLGDIAAGCEPYLLTQRKGQMLSKSRTPVQPLYGPTSNKVIPPTPTFLTQKAYSNLEDVTSPRSDEDSDIYKDRLGQPYELSRSRTFFKDEFILEESRPKDPFIRSSSGSDTLSSSGSSHLSSSSTDSPMTLKGKGAKYLKTNSVKANQQVTGKKTDNAGGANSDSGVKVNEKKTQNGPQGQGLKVNGSGMQDSRNSPVINSKTNGNAMASNTSVLHSMATRNASVVTANNGNAKNANNKNGATKSGQSGGFIVVHSEFSDIRSESEKKRDKMFSRNTERNDEVKSVGEACPDKLNNNVTEKQNESPKSGINGPNKASENGAAKGESKPAQVSNAKKKAQAKMQNVLQVVPTKLTQNIVRTAPKAVKENKAETKTVSNKVNAKPTGTQGVKNVNMQLSPSAQVVNRVAGQANAASDKADDSPTKDKENITDNKQMVSQVSGQAGETDKKDNANTQNVKKNNVNVIGKTNTADSSRMAQNDNRLGAQSRNSGFSVPKSTTPVQKPTAGNVRKTNSSYTQRVQTNNPSSSTLEKSMSEAKLTLNTSVANATATKAADAASASSLKPQKSSSPTDLVPPSVCKTTSVLKSYNMSSNQPTVTKSPSSGSLSSESTNVTKSTASPTTTTTDSNKAKTTKHSVLSKSVSEPIQAKASNSKVSNSGISVSKSISQMPCVGTVTSTRGIQKSPSMSNVEEAKPNKLMSSSDTRIQKDSISNKKQRPASDGSVVVATKEEDNLNPNGVTPLVDILPEGLAKINRRNYIDINNPITTPVIVNPFEELEQNREKENMQKLGARAVTATEFGFIIDKPAMERSKTQASLKSRGNKGTKRSSNKPSSAQSRGASARKKRSKSKEPGNKSDNENSRPKSGKSGKRVRSGKRKRKVPGDNLGKQNEQDDVALIGGIGWQIATSCIDKSDADAVMVSAIDSSESDSELTEVVPSTNPLKIDIPIDHLVIPNAIETPSSVYSPRFKEVPSERHEKELAFVDNDGYRPMNLDMTQKSVSSQNRSGVIVGKDMPEDIGDFLSYLKHEDNEVFAEDEAEYYIDDDYSEYTQGNGMDDDDDDDVDTDDDENIAHRVQFFHDLTPIPESPSLSNTLTSIQKTTAAIHNFDKTTKDHELNKLLGETPRDKTSSKDTSSTKTDKSSAGSLKTNSLRNSGNTIRSSQKDSQKSPITSAAQAKNQQIRNSSSKSQTSRTSSLSAEIKERANRAMSKSLNSPKANIGEVKSMSKTYTGATNNSASLRKSGSKEKLSKSQDLTRSTSVESNESKQGGGDTADNVQTKERIDSKVMDLKKLLADKMQTTQKLLEDSAPYSSYKRKQSEENSEGLDREGSEIKLNIQPLTEENLKALTSRTDEDAKSTRSSRKERKFSETKNETRDDDMKEAIDEILSNTFPSSKGTLKAHMSMRSASSTLTEADRKVLAKMVKENQESPFHAKQQVRISSSYDESVTLNKDNPELMKRFHADNYKVGQKVHAMVEAGADKGKVKAMLNVDNEAKQLARIMNSFKQMELYAGTSNNKSSKRETPRRDGDHMFRSLSKFDQHLSGAGHHHSGMPPRPGSAGAGRHRPGKFTEIKGGKSATTETRERLSSPVNVPKDLADEFARSPYVRVWCGLTSEGQLIAVKQIELNTASQQKAMKEYEKVQEEVELLKTLEHKNIVGYLGTSLEDSIVSIFMQFVPGGSIASILARFGALDEAVFRKYTRQILEGTSREVT
ncbi:M3K19-like protein [Mya arenaria]|uniref:M3K19-like protein n=1 Tax=Mya arenaria TaxID=6604 RepID=A0ABY7DYX5_MYAAR|nr:M3K19-like protein [Mya arenaria]